MKKLKWFRIDEEIPDNAVYIKSDEIVVRYIMDETPMGTDQLPVLEQMHLYEVPEPKGKKLRDRSL